MPNDATQLTPPVEAWRREVARLRLSVIGLSIIVVAGGAWLGLRSPRFTQVLSVERLEIVESDGSLAFVFANSQRPVGGTIDGQVVMEGQEEERRGVPSIVFFDGQGDEVGGFLTGTRTEADGYAAVRHLSLDGYKQDQTVVLAHYQDSNGSTAGLRVSDRPQGHSILDALRELGLAPGAPRAELRAAMEALPEDGRATRLRELFGVERIFLGSGRTRNASLVLNDGQGRPRIRLTVPEDGMPSIEMLDDQGEPVLRLPS